ncbi:MAG TPA: permease-like cell division protein FtsX [Candidatus Acidoferrum sp.]|nr:permease-like cell division protein FtsX [Candidatus Acidoferrum sp.]
MNNNIRRWWITQLRIFSYGLRNFWRNAWLSTAATIVMTVTLLIIITTFTAQLVASSTIRDLRQKIYTSVYLLDDADQAEVARFAHEVAGVPIVTSVQYITKAQAQEEFVAQHQGQLAALEALGEIDTNPFPASLRIKTSDPSKLSLVNKVINQRDNKALEDTQTTQAASNANNIQSAIDTVTNVSQFAKLAGLVAGAVFVFISVMIIFNTIRMTIFNRRDEIEIMKLIGAEKRFIRGPFIVEASLYGVLAAVISLVIIYAVLLTKASALSGFLNTSDAIIFFRTWPILIVPAQIALGALIGIISALLAIRRYLKA